MMNKVHLKMKLKVNFVKFYNFIELDLHKLILIKPFYIIYNIIKMKIFRLLHSITYLKIDLQFIILISKL